MATTHTVFIIAAIARSCLRYIANICTAFLQNLSAIERFDVHLYSVFTTFIGSLFVGAIFSRLSFVHLLKALIFTFSPRNTWS